MPYLYRLATGALPKVTTLPKIVSASFNRSAVLCSATLFAKPFQAPSIPKISDIFDAPVKLRERKTYNEPSSVLSILSLVREGAPPSKRICNDALDLPLSLPPPVIFDGPACPPHMTSSTLKRRRLQRQNLAPFPRGGCASSAVSYNTLISQSTTFYQLFDGPSRAARFQYSTSKDEQSSFTCVSLVLCLSTTFGWFVLKGGMEQIMKDLHDATPVSPITS